MQNNESTEARSRRRIVITAVSLVMVALVMAVLAVTLFFSRYRFYEAQSASMLPTLQPGARFRVDQWAFRGGKLPRRGDIVVYDTPPQAGEDGGAEATKIIHRVIALPGDSIKIRAASLTLGGHPLDPDKFDADTVRDLLRKQFGIPSSTAVTITQNGVMAAGKTYPLSTMPH